jgi:ABC-type uncharacterized transport system involved in gliding motility auxiliary subunit
MNTWRRWTGLGALLLAAAALNLIFWTENLFALPVLIPLAGGLALGAAWLVGVLLAVARPGALEGRTVGGLNAVVSSLVFLGICVVIYMFLQSWNVSYDLTQEGRRELSPLTQQVLRNINAPVEVTCFFLRVDDELVVIAREKTRRFLAQCRQHTDQIKVEELDPTIDPTRLAEMGIKHASVQGTVVVKSGGRQRIILLSGGSPRLEEREFTNALINVLRDAQPKVYFLTGHKERDVQDDKGEDGAAEFAKRLAGESYQVDRLAIKISDPQVPADCDVLVIDNLKVDLHPLEMEAIDKYVSAGGRLLILFDPWRSVTPGYGGGEQLRPWLERRLGIKVGSDIVITDKAENLWQLELSNDARPFEQTEAGFMQFHGCFNAEHPITRSFDQTVLLKAVRSVGLAEKPPEGVIGVELLRSTPDFWAETDTEKLLTTGKARLNDGERKGPIPVAVAVSPKVPVMGSPKGRTDTRVVVVGDSDFTANSQVVVSGNLNFVLNLFAWMSESEDLIAIRPTGREAVPLVLTEAQRRTAAWVGVMLTLQFVAAAGALVFLLRRKYQ